MDWKKFAKGETTNNKEELSSLDSLDEKKVSLREVNEYERNKKQEKKNTKEQARLDKGNNKLSSHGFDNPTSVTRYSYDSQNMMASFDKFYNGIGMLTFNMEKQATFNFYNNQLKQSFMIAAQNDELIKQNDKISDQNEEMIKLLSQIANK